MRRWLYMMGGGLSLLLGLLGMVLPLLPTTPLVLLSAALFARSSPRAHRWLLSHPWFGPPLRDWQHHGGMRSQTRRRALLLVVCGFGFSLLLVPGWWLRGLLLVVMVLVLAGLWRVPVIPADEA